MWYSFYSYPSSFFLNFYWYSLYIKANQVIDNFYHRYLVNKISFNVSLVNMRYSYNFMLSQILDILINFFEVLPVTVRVKFCYRRAKYIEIFVISGTITKKKKAYFKVLNELIFLLFFTHIRNLRIVGLRNSFIYKFLMSLDLKFLCYYAKFLPLRFCVIMNIQLISIDVFNFLDFEYHNFFKKVLNLVKNGFKNFS